MAEETITEPTFNLKVSTDYHLNQDGRPVPDYDFLVPLYADDESVLFFNPRYHIDDQTNLHQAEEWNLGLGYRKMIGDKAVLGTNVYYDWRRSMTGNQFEQVGAGLELMTEDVTARLNGYLALSGSEEVSRYRWREYYFAPRSINYTDYERVTWEVPTSGFDGEIGVRVPFISDYAETWVYGGGYYFQPVSSVGGAETMEGIKGRIEVKPTDYLKASCEIRDDNVRGTAYYGEIAVEVPFSIENLVAGKNPFEGLKEKVVEPSYEVALADRMYDKVVRDPDIITGYTAGTPGDSDIVINNGVLADVRYVKNSSTSAAEDGSWANPFKTINGALDTAGAYPFDPADEVIFVLAGSTLATYANKYGDFEINTTTCGGNGTTIWGQGYKPAGVSMPHGLGVSYPKIYGTATINADNVEIMGLNFAPTMGTITPLILNGKNSLIHHNEFRPGLLAPGMVINGDSALIENNKFYSSFRGIEVDGGTGSMIAGNTFTIAYTGSTAWSDIHPTEYGIAGIFANVVGEMAPEDPSPLLDITIDGNIFTVTNNGTNTTSGPYAHAIDINVVRWDDLPGTPDDLTELYAVVTNNTIKVTSTCRAPDTWTEGIHLFSSDSLYAKVYNNNMSTGVSGYWNAAGITLGEYYDNGRDVNTRYLYTDVIANKMKVTSINTTASTGEAYGIRMKAYAPETFSGVIGTVVRENDLSLGITGRGFASGISIWGTRCGDMPEDPDYYYEIADNRIKVTSNGDRAMGILLVGEYVESALVSGNNLSTGVTSTLGALSAGITFDGRFNNLIATDNVLKVGAPKGEAFGIGMSNDYAWYDSSVRYAIIGNNTMTAGITGLGSAAGVYFDIYSYEYDAAIRIANRFTVFNNALMVKSTGDKAYGIYLHSEGYSDFGGGIYENIGGTIDATIVNNTMSLGISGKYWTAGIDVYSGVPREDDPMFMGDSSTDLVITGNTLKVTSSAGTAAGIFALADPEMAMMVSCIMGTVSDNNLSPGITGKTDAYGIYLRAVSIGWHDPTIPDEPYEPIDIENNAMKVTGTVGEAYGIRLDTTSGYSWVTPTGSFSYGTGEIVGIDVGLGYDGITDYGVYIQSEGSKNKIYLVDSTTGLDIDGPWSFAGTNGTAGLATNIVDEYLYASLYPSGPIRIFDIIGGGSFLFEVANFNAPDTYLSDAAYIGDSLYLADEERGIYRLDPTTGTVLNHLASIDRPAIAGWTTMPPWSATPVDYVLIGDPKDNRIYVIDPTLANSSADEGIIAEFTLGLTSGPVERIAVYDNTLFAASGNTVTTYDLSMMGIGMGSAFGVCARINGNNLSAGITGGMGAEGIYLHGNSIFETEVRGNLLKVTTTFSGIDTNLGKAYGIRAETARFNDPWIGGYNVLEMDITGNNMSYGISGKNIAGGIMLSSPYGTIGDESYRWGAAFDEERFLDPISVLGNTIKATSSAGGAYGIEMDAGIDIAADVTGNNMSAGITGSTWAAGIELWAGRNIGENYYGKDYDSGDWHISGELTPILITGNTLKVTASKEDATGISLHAYALGDMDLGIAADISRNIMTKEIKGKTLAAGILLESYGDIGACTYDTWYESATDTTWTDVITLEKIAIDRNSMKVTSTADYAVGIWGFAEGDLFVDALKNDLSLGVSGRIAAGGIILGVDPITNTAEYHFSDCVDVGISDNVLKVTSTYTGTVNDDVNGRAVGIMTGANGSVWYEFDPTAMIGGSLKAEVLGNNLSKGITGKYDATGILVLNEIQDGEYGTGMGPSGGTFATIRGNTLMVKSTADDAVGIDVESVLDLHADVSFNNLAAGVTAMDDAEGILLVSRDLVYGDPPIPFPPLMEARVDGNTLKTTSTAGDTVGIHLESDADILAETSVSNNNMLGGVTGKYTAEGIVLEAVTNIGISSLSYPATSTLSISGNRLKVTSTNTVIGTTTPETRVSGIRLTSDFGTIYGHIMYNDMSQGIIGNCSTLPTADSPMIAGIYLGAALDTGIDDGMGSILPTLIENNSLKVTNTNATPLTSSATGIYGLAGGNLYAYIARNNLNIKAYTNTSGASLEGDTLGVPFGAPYTGTMFVYNRGTVDGTLANASGGERYLVDATKTGAAFPAILVWGANSVTPVTGGWTGNYPNYPMSTSGPLFLTGFNPGGADFVIP